MTDPLFHPLPSLPIHRGDDVTDLPWALRLGHAATGAVEVVLADYWAGAAAEQMNALGATRGVQAALLSVVCNIAAQVALQVRQLSADQQRLLYQQTLTDISMSLASEAEHAVVFNGHRASLDPAVKKAAADVLRRAQKKR